MNTWVLPSCGWFGEHSGGGVTGNILALSTPEPRSLPPSRGSLFPASATPDQGSRNSHAGPQRHDAAGCARGPRSRSRVPGGRGFPSPGPAQLCGCGPAAGGAARGAAADSSGPRAPGRGWGGGRAASRTRARAEGTGRVLTPSPTAGPRAPQLRVGCAGLRRPGKPVRRRRV